MASPSAASPPPPPPSDPSDREPVTRARRVVVKVGSGVITSQVEGLLPDRIAAIADQVGAQIRGGREVILVTSGAVAAGLAVMKTRSVRGIPMRQAAAAAGQSRLIWKYEQNFQRQNLHVAQVLLTQDDISSRHRFLNASNTFATLLAQGLVPVVNENDSVAVDEIKFGDNDTLSGLVAQVADADLLVMLTDVDGLYSADPRHHPEARKITTVPQVTDDIRAMAGGAGSREGTGGMVTKLDAAERLAQIGIPTLLVDGTQPDSLTRALAGEPIGTLFLPAATPRSPRKHWLAHMVRMEGRIHLDAGAARALASGRRSLLPAGIVNVEGNFGMGAGVALIDPDGHEVARGLSNYGTADITRIQGCQTGDIPQRLGYKAYDEVIHVDNLVVTTLDR